jgi:hypothetical protein
MTVVEFELVADGVFQFAGAAMDAAAQLLFGEACEPAFHQVEGGGAGRGEVQMEARMTHQPTLDGRGFVGGVIVGEIRNRDKTPKTSRCGSNRPVSGVARDANCARHARISGEAKVVLACRSMDKARAAAAQITASNPKAAVEVMELDLSSLASVHRLPRSRPPRTTFGRGRADSPVPSRTLPPGSSRVGA